MGVRDAIKVLDLLVESSRERVNLLVDRRKPALDPSVQNAEGRLHTIQSTLDAIESAIHSIEPTPDSPKAAGDAPILSGEAQIHVFLELRNGHANASKHSIVAMR